MPKQKNKGTVVIEKEPPVYSNETKTVLCCQSCDRSIDPEDPESENYREAMVLIGVIIKLKDINIPGNSMNVIGENGSRTVYCCADCLGRDLGVLEP